MIFCKYFIVNLMSAPELLVVFFFLEKLLASDQNLHLDDGSGVSDLSPVSYRKRIVSQLQVKLLEVDLDHLERWNVVIS